jgi:hypothetical protein
LHFSHFSSHCDAAEILLTINLLQRRHDIQQNDVQHNDIKQNDTQHNDIQ